MKYRIEVLSPIHIGSGNKYKPIDCIIKKQEVFIFDEKDVIKNIKGRYMLDSSFLSSISYSGKRAKFYQNLDSFIDSGIIDKNVLNKVKIKAKNKTTNIKGKEIQGIMRNLNGPFIPGSTLKGVVRTAIFYDYVKNKGINWIKAAIKEIKNNRKLNSIEDFIIGGEKKNVQKDPFRFLNIMDINLVEDNVSIYEESIFNMKSNFPGDILETINEGCLTEEFKFGITFKNIKENIRNEMIDRLKLDKNLVSYLENKEILKALYEYSKDIIEEEIEYYKNCSSKVLNTSEILKQLQKFKDINTESSPIIRIGKGTGYLSHTLGIIIKRLDKNYYDREFIKYIRPPKHDEKYEFPKSRKFVGQAISPKLLGFALIKKVD